MRERCANCPGLMCDSWFANAAEQFNLFANRYSEGKVYLLTKTDTEAVAGDAPVIINSDEETVNGQEVASEFQMHTLGMLKWTLAQGNCKLDEAQIADTLEELAKNQQALIEREG